MLFTSYAFIVFLTIVIVLYYVFPKKIQWVLLLIASYFFYFCANPVYLLFIFVSTLCVYLCTLWMDYEIETNKKYMDTHPDICKADKKNIKEKLKAKNRKIMLIALLLNLGILAITKYTNFFIKNLNTFLPENKEVHEIDLIIPLGISFYTFQVVSYLVDVYRGKQCVQKNFFKLALFVSFFPQLIQGPISRYSDLSETLYGEHKYNKENILKGLTRVLWGYFKKVVIADRIITAVTTLIQSPEHYKGSYVFVAMMFYAFELYCDFTGGIDITIGIGQMLGIKIKENFNLPYFSKSIKEYWNRWHITMGTWFTDYIFYPISVSSPFLRISKWARKSFGEQIGKRVPLYLSSLVVWFATGIWHGAAWNFIVWGLTNYAVIMISQELEPLYAKFYKRCPIQGEKPWELFRIIRTILLMSCIRMFDCYRNVPITLKMIGTMFTSFNLNIYTDGSLLKLGLSIADYVVLILGFAIILMISILNQRGTNIRTMIYEKSRILNLCVIAVLFVVILTFGAYGHGYNSSQFIYNQF